MYPLYVCNPCHKIQIVHCLELNLLLLIKVKRKTTDIIDDRVWKKLFVWVIIVRIHSTILNYMPSVTLLDALIKQSV